MPKDDNDSFLEQMVRERILKNKPSIEHSLRQIAAGNPLGSETVQKRMVQRIAKKTSLSMRDSESVSRVIEAATERVLLEFPH
jgi:endonuclease G